VGAPRDPNPPLSAVAIEHWLRSDVARPRHGAGRRREMRLVASHAARRFPWKLCHYDYCPGTQAGVKIPLGDGELTPPGLGNGLGPTLDELERAQAGRVRRPA